tara:strand:- start:540 stop:764 length:225 start_codon:yes stop_codon:yes gene_type:complete
MAKDRTKYGRICVIRDGEFVDLPANAPKFMRDGTEPVEDEREKLPTAQVPAGPITRKELAKLLKGRGTKIRAVR